MLSSTNVRTFLFVSKTLSTFKSPLHQELWDGAVDLVSHPSAANFIQSSRKDSQFFPLTVSQPSKAYCKPAERPIHRVV
jgi:hypothetical protein